MRNCLPSFPLDRREGALSRISYPVCGTIGSKVQASRHYLCTLLALTALMAQMLETDQMPQTTGMYFLESWMLQVQDHGADRVGSWC